jgi:thiol-disulfide isomerase/thioredoxin
MARTPSNMIPLRSKASGFKLFDTASKTHLSLDELKGKKGTVIMFICNHCPFVVHVNPEISQLAKDYKTKGINCIAISSNDIENYPQDAPHLMTQNAIDNDYSFPYLYDESQDVAKAYNAACTPDFYVYNENLELVYRGQLDDSRPGNGIPITGKDLREALDNLLNNQPISNTQKPSIGCNIKWKMEY